MSYDAFPAGLSEGDKIDILLDGGRVQENEVTGNDGATLTVKYPLEQTTQQQRRRGVKPDPFLLSSEEESIFFSCLRRAVEELRPHKHLWRSKENIRGSIFTTVRRLIREGHLHHENLHYLVVGDLKAFEARWRQLPEEQRGRLAAMFDNLMSIGTETPKPRLEGMELVEAQLTAMGANLREMQALALDAKKLGKQHDEITASLAEFE
jgi:hypothetical protein